MKYHNSFCKFLCSCLVLISLLTSCNNDAHKIRIDLNKDLDGLTIQVDTLIILETNEPSLIGEVFKVVQFNGMFYVLDILVSKNVFLFNKDGQFITSLSKGKGPGETIDPVDVFIDRRREVVMVWDQGKRELLTFDQNLNFLNSEYYELLYIRATKFIDEDRLLVEKPNYDDNKGKQEKFLLYGVYNLRTKVYESKFFPIQRDLISLSSINPISVTPERVLFSAPFDNSLYTLEGNGYREVMHFDFGEMGITADDINKGNRYVFSESWAGRKIIPFYSISENERYMALNFGLYGKDNFFIYSKATNEAYFSFNLVNQGLLPTCRLSGQIGEDQFIAFASPADVIEFGKINPMAASIQNEIDELSNPCIIIFSIREDN